MRTLLLLSSLLILGCSESSDPIPGGDEDMPAGEDASMKDMLQDMSLTDASQDMQNPPNDGLVPIIYAHSADTLYSLDPITRAVSVVGRFDGCTRVIDIAINKKQHIYATTSQGLFIVDPLTAKCTEIASAPFPNSLSFVPTGTLFENQETLVGYNGSDYVRISLVTGEQTIIGKLSDQYQSSGDIVSVQGGKTFLTVRGPDCTPHDCLFEVDPVTGDRIKNWGSVQHESVFGLAFWSGKVFGFSSTGDFFEIGFQNDELTITPLTFPDAPADLTFWGAGSTTIAPIFE